MKFRGILAIILTLTFSSQLSAQDKKSVQPQKIKEASLVTTGCTATGIFMSLTGIFAGCSRGTNGFGAGLFAGVYHALPPVKSFALDGDGYLMVRWTIGSVGFEAYGGAGADAFTKSGSGRGLLIVGTPPRPAGLFLSLVGDYYPKSWNFRNSDYNAGQFDGEFRFGPSFLIPGQAKLTVIPFVGVGFVDSRHMDEWRARLGFFMALPL